MTGLFILLYIFYALFIFFLNKPLHLLLAALPVILLYIRLPWENLRRGLIITLLFALFIFLANQLNPEGEIILERGFILVANDSLKKGTERALRLLILVMSAKILLWRFSAEELLKGIERLLGPLGKKKAVKDFTETALLTLKALPGVKRELQRLYSERCRDKSLIQRMRATGLIIVAVLTKAINAPEEFF